MTDKYDLFPSLLLYDQLKVPYVVHGGGWDGPVWTGHCMMLDASDYYDDVGFFHELAHWAEASEEQRKYPDFKLGKQINASRNFKFTSSTTPHYHDGDTVPATSPQFRNKNVGWGEDTVALSTATRQETNACYAMYFYGPLVVEDWDADVWIPSAAVDFDGPEQALDKPATTVVGRVSKIIETITGEDMTPGSPMFKTAVGFFNRMKQLNGENA